MSVAGGLGAGPGTDISQSPVGLGLAGDRLSVVDGPTSGVDLPPIGVGYPGLVWRADVSTGQTVAAAGTGFSEFSGDGAPATDTTFSNVADVAAAPDGSFYVSDTGNNRIRKVSASGVVTTVVGTGVTGTGGDGGPAVNAQVASATDLALGPSGELYIADQGRIRKIDAAGVMTALNPVPGPPTEPPLAWAAALDVDASGNLYVADIDANRIRRVSPDGTMTTVAGTGKQYPYVAEGDGGPALAAAVNGPRAVAIAPDGTLYIGQAYKVRKVDPATHVIRTVTGTRDRPGFAGDGGPAAQGVLADVRDIELDGAGNLYIADGTNRRVRRVGTDGIITTFSGNGLVSDSGDGGPATWARLRVPGRLASSSDGLTLVDAGNERLRRVDVAGTITTIRNTRPAGITHDREGTLYVSEGAQVLRVAGSGDATPVVGTGEPGSSGDGGPAAVARIATPGALAFAGDGSLFVADDASGEIRRVDRQGTITTFARRTSAPLEYGDGEATGTTTGLWNVSSMAVGPDGTLYYAEYGRLRKVVCGVFTQVDLGGTSVSPGSVAVDAAGTLFVALADRIVSVDRSGTVTTVVGGGTLDDYDGRPATSARLSYVQDLTIDATGRLLFSHRDQVWAVDGVAAPAAVPGNPCYELPDRVVRGFGWNGVGQLGDGTTGSRTPPTPPETLPGAIAVAAGGYHSLALRQDGTVWAWGWNALGQLGDGTTVDRAVPFQVPGLTDVQAIAAGLYHSLAVRRDGTVWAWGWNGVGQVGDGTTVDRHRPVQVPGLTGVTSVSGGAFHTLALDRDGSVWSWGWNAVGQLGDGTRVDRHRPVRLAGVADITAIAAGGYHSLALHRLGIVGAWGWNGTGQLGTGTNVDSVWPVPVAGLEHVSAIAAGALHSLALLSDGTVRAWGWNAYAQLGVYTTSDSNVPLVVRNLPKITAIAAGGYHSLALVDDGYIVGWGLNMLGQATARPSDPVLAPFHVAYFPGARSIAAGALHSLAVWDFRRP